MFVGSGLGTVALTTVIEAHVAMLTCSGATKSLSSLLKLVDARDFTYADEKPSQTPTGMMPEAVRSIAVSPNCPAGTGFGRPNGFASDVVLIAASATTPETGALHAVPVQVRISICGVPCPGTGS